MSRGNIYIISGPSGSGKDTILKEVLKIRSDVFFSISHIITSILLKMISQKLNLFFIYPIFFFDEL